MAQSRQELDFMLASILQEYLVICEELKGTTDSQRAIRMRAMAAACIADYQETIRQYRATTQRLS